MKKIGLVFSLLFIFASSSKIFSQLKIGYVDSDAIMKQLPDAQDTQKKLDAIIKDWQNEVRKLEDIKKTKQVDYDKRKLLMTEQTRKDLEDDIKKADQQITDYRDKKFIPFSQFGRKIYIKRADLEAFMQKNYIKQ